MEQVNKKKPSGNKYNKRHNNSHKPNHTNIKIYSLGGLGVVGMNIYVVEVNNELIIMDAGILFAGGEEHGVNYIIPDFKHLKENENRIKALFITHGHEDHIGSLPFLLKDVKIPVIYANGLAIGLIKNKFSEFPDIKYNLVEYKDDTIVKFKHCEVSFFRTNHSIPDSFGIAIKTKLGYIVNTGDFKFDYTPIGERADYYKMSKLGEEGVLCLMADSTNALIHNASLSEKKIGQNLNDLFHQINGRIIVATFASNVYRVQQIIQASLETNRKIAIFGHSMETTIEEARKLNYINVDSNDIINSRNYKKLRDIDPKRLTILCTGSQGEPLAALSKISSNTHKFIQLDPTDTIIFSSKPIPGNEQFINRTINKLVKSGANIIRNSPLSDTHTTGHASQEEIKLMFSLIRPKYFMPAHGEVAMLKSHINIAMEMGVDANHCFPLKAGDVLQFTDNEVTVMKQAVPAGDIYIDNSLTDVDSSVLKERVRLAQEGFLGISFTINSKKQIIAKPNFKTLGFIDETNLSNAELLNKMKLQATEILKNILSHVRKYNESLIRNQFISQYSNFIRDLTDKNPVIVVTINHIVKE